MQSPLLMVVSRMRLLGPLRVRVPPPPNKKTGIFFVARGEVGALLHYVLPNYSYTPLPLTDFIFLQASRCKHHSKCCIIYSPALLICYFFPHLKMILASWRSILLSWQITWLYLLIFLLYAHDFLVSEIVTVTSLSSCYIYYYLALSYL